MITKKHLIPTGYLFTSKCSKGELETLSIGDYGKHFNVKADFLGFRDEIKGVPNTFCMPLSEKWVITISTQYGCAVSCNFCLKPDAKVNTPIGKVNISDIKKDDYVIGYDVKNNQLRVNKVTKPMSREYEGILINIELENGKVLSATPEHEVFLKNGQVKCIKDLTINDEIIDF